VLVGNYRYGEDIYNLIGYDYGDTVVLHLTCPLTKSIRVVDKGIYLPDGTNIPPRWETLYMSVGSGNISVDLYMEEDEGVKCRSELNDNFFCCLGSIIRGMKVGCNRDNLVDNDNLFNVEFNPMKRQQYQLENGKSVLELGILKELHYNGPLGKLHLTDDGSYSEKIFEVTKLKKKIKLDLSEFITVVEDSSDWDFNEEDKIFSLQEIIERNPDKNYVWLKNRKYKIVKSIEELEAICKMIWQHNGVVAFDTETTGLKVNIKSRVGQADRLVGMVFSIKPGEAYYFPIAHKKIQNICSAGNEHYIIDKYFKPILEKKDILCHNGAFDWKVMYNYGICTNIVHDTLILFKVTLWNDHTNLKLGLKPLVKTFLGRDSFELSDFVVGKFDSQNIKFWDLEEESVKYYACPDTDSLLELYEYAMQNNLLGTYDAKKIYEIEVLFSIVIAYQEYYGHCVDVDRIDSLIEAIKRDKEETYARMVDLVGMDFNPKSSPDMKKICFEKLGLPVIDYTETGAPSTGKDVRKAWLKSSEVSDEKKAFVKDLNTYLDAQTLESNFTKNIDKFATEDGLMFSEVQQFLATGRVSTKDPNYQGYSDTVKKYIGPREGFYAMDADYSSVEARIMCSMAGCQAMVEKLKDPDADYHRLKASDMFGVPYELVTDSLRKMSKGVNFGILYGLGDPNLGVNLYGSKSPENTRKAKHQKELYFKGMEELRGFIEESKAQGITQNFSTTYFRRRRYYDPRKDRKDKIERQSCNARIQGTAADIYKSAMVRLFLEVRNRGLLGKILISAFVHDECYLEIHKSINPGVMLKVLRDSMMLDIEGWCPLYTGMGFGRTWYEAKHTEIPVQVQEMISDNYGETGMDWWDGNTKKLCDWTVNEILLYKKNRVLDYLKDKENWGKVFKPTENELCHSLLKDIKGGLTVEGVVVDDATTYEDMLENLAEFCRVFDCMDLYEKANIQKPIHKEQNSSLNTIEVNENDEEEEDMKQTLIMRVNTMGVHSQLSDGKREIYFRYDENNSVLMGLVRKTLESMPGDIPVYAIKNGEEYSTGLSTDVKVYPKLLQLYLSSRNLKV